MHGKLLRVSSLHARRLASTSSGGPLRAYEKLVADGSFRHDERQARALVPLQRLFDELAAPTSAAGTAGTGGGGTAGGGIGGLWAAFGFSGGGERAALAKVVAPRGVYTYGGVGCGKTVRLPGPRRAPP